MIDKLEAIKKRFEEVSKQIIDPDVISDMKRYIKLNKEYKDLEIIVNAYSKYSNVISNIDSAKEILSKESDLELKEMAKSKYWLCVLKFLSINQFLRLSIFIILYFSESNF